MIPKKYKIGENQTDFGTPDGKAILYGVLKEAIDTADSSISETEYRKQAESGYRMYAGDQDEAWIKARCLELNLPMLVFNQIKSKIDVLVGVAAEMKTPPGLSGTEDSDDVIVEILDGSARYHRNKLKVTRKELDCFGHAAKSGRSFLYYYVDNENPYELKIRAKVVPGYDIVVDPRSTDYSLEDARYIAYSRWFSPEELESMWPDGFDNEKVKSGFGQTTGPTSTDRTDIGKGSPALSSGMTSGAWYDRNTNCTRVVEIWFWDIDYGRWFINEAGESEFVIESSWNDVKKILNSPDLEGLPGTKKVLKYAIMGYGEIIDFGSAPSSYSRFPFAQFGAYKDDFRNSWLSVIHTMKDIQIGINGLRRQLIHLIMTAPKPLLMAEAGAILNEDEYLENSARPNFILKTAPGALARGAIQFTHQAQISPIYAQVDSTLVDEAKASSGILNDLMGMQTTSREPGITVQLRQQGILATLRSLFDNYKDSKLQSAEILLFMIQTYVSQDKMARILGERGVKLLQLTADAYSKAKALEYDLILDDDSEGTMRLAVGKMLIEMEQAKPGSIPPAVLAKYVNLPFSIRQEIEQYTIAAQEGQQANTDEEHLIEWAKIVADLTMNQQGLQAKTEEIKAKAKDLQARNTKNGKRK